MTDEKKDKRTKLGEILVEYGIITSNMLKNALKRQSQTGGHIGSILIEMGYLTTDTLLDFLSKQFGVPAANLFKLDIPPEVIKALPLDKIKEYKVIPIETDEKFTLAMVNPQDYVAIKDLEFIVGKRVHPVVVPSSQMDAALKSLSSTGPGELIGSELEKTIVHIPEESSTDMKNLLRHLVESKATDLQLTAGVPPSLKMGTELQRLKLSPLTPEMMSDYARILLNEEHLKRFDRDNDIDFAFTDVDFGRCRVNMYKQRNSVSITIRRIPDLIPGFGELGLPPEAEEFALKSQGLILVTGPAGHGKSTTLAALVDIINTKKKCNIITLEDPIEFLHKHKNSNVNQREIGTDTASFQEGLHHIFRQDPDVIVIGEMRDPDSFQIALRAAETGHLVLSTLHSRNTTATVERVIDIFPPHQQAQIRVQLAESLLLVLSQRLLTNKDRSGLVLAYEKLENSFKIKNFIREGKTHLIRAQMQAFPDEYVPIDVTLARLCSQGKITLDEGLKHADNLTYYQDLVRNRSALGR